MPLLPPLQAGRGKTSLTRTKWAMTALWSVSKPGGTAHREARQWESWYLLYTIHHGKSFRDGKLSGVFLPICASHTKNANGFIDLML